MLLLQFNFKIKLTKGSELGRLGHSMSNEPKKCTSQPTISDFPQI